MARPRSGGMLASLVLVWMAAATTGCTGRQTVPSWSPAAFRDLDTLEFRTVGPEEGEHWSTVWLVVVDDQVYIRLGARAAVRMQTNTTAGMVAVRVGGKEYPQVRAEERADMAGRVAAAMGEKYWTDLLIRYAPHPLTMQLRPDPANTAGE